MYLETLETGNLICIHSALKSVDHRLQPACYVIDTVIKTRYQDGHLDVSVDDLVLVQVAQPFQDLPCVEDDGGLLQWTPLGPQQGR